MRLIDADKLLENYNLKNADKRGGIGFETLMKYEVSDMIADAPTVDAAPVVYGRWVVKYDESIGARFDTCSVCGYALKAIGEGKRMNYCLNCGADMRKGKENE